MSSLLDQDATEMEPRRTSSPNRRAENQNPTAPRTNQGLEVKESPSPSSRGRKMSLTFPSYRSGFFTNHRRLRAAVWNRFSQFPLGTRADSPGRTRLGRLLIAYALRSARRVARHFTRHNFHGTACLRCYAASLTRSCNTHMLTSSIST